MSTEEQGFADVLNGFSLDAGRSRRRAERASPTTVATSPAQLPEQYQEPIEENASIVRAYAWTGGRTRTDFRLEIETLLSTSVRALDTLWELATEHQEVAELCRLSKSVAEVAALLKLPLGVVKVVVGDMASLGLLVVHENETVSPDMELLERVLRGLTNLRT